MTTFPPVTVARDARGRWAVASDWPAGRRVYGAYRSPEMAAYRVRQIARSRGANR